MPAQGLDLRAIETNDRHVAFPAAVAARELIPCFTWSEAAYLDRQFRNFSDSNVVISGNVKDIILAGRAQFREANRFQDVLDMDVTFLLSAIAKDAQTRRIHF